MSDDNSRPKPVSNTDEIVPQQPLKFAELARGKQELTIEHEGQLYRLRATRNGKLLLNK